MGDWLAGWVGVPSSWCGPGDRLAGKAAAVNAQSSQPALHCLLPHAEAQQGKFVGPHPVPGGGRILQALRFGGAGK